MLHRNLDRLLSVVDAAVYVDWSRFTRLSEYSDRILELLECGLAYSQLRFVVNYFCYSWMIVFTCQ